MTTYTSLGKRKKKGRMKFVTTCMKVGRTRTNLSRELRGTTLLECPFINWNRDHSDQECVLRI